MSVENIQFFSPQKENVFILDTNVMIKLLYPSLSGNHTKQYEKLYADILSVNAKIIISAIQISEFINRCIRFQFGLWAKEQSKNVDFKRDYRDTDDYRVSMNAILDIIKNDILSVATYVDDQFTKMDKTALYQYGFSYDFNDSMIAEIARINHAILITDDKDFANCTSRIRVITGNKSLLLFR